MPLLPLRLLPVDDAPDGPLTMRVEVKPSGSAYVYVRRESSKKTWLCTVRTLQEILAPSQQARSMAFVAVVMCLYHGIAYDSSSTSAGFTTGPVELRRREVAFSQPESWTGDSYRLTMRACIRSSSVATPVAQLIADSDAPMAAIPVVDVAEEDVVFGLNFEPCDTNLDHVDVKLVKYKKRFARLEATSTAFPNSFVRWEHCKDTDFLVSENDGVYHNPNGVDRFYATHGLEVELHIVHAKDAGVPLFVMSVNSRFLKPTNSTSYPVGDLHHTVANYVLKVASKAFFQVAILPGSACAVAGTTIAFRETGI